MKIVFLVHRFWPGVGGVEKYVGALSGALLELGHEVQVVAGAHDPDLPEREHRAGLDIHRFPALRSPLRSSAWLWSRRLIFRRADIISVSNTHMLEFFRRSVGRWIDARKVFLIRHGTSGVYPVSESHRRRAVAANRRVAGVAHDGHFIERWLGVKPDICPDQGLRPPADQIIPRPEPAPDSAAFIGRLEPDTGIRMYAEAVRRFTQEDRRPFRLDVYGDGSLAGPLIEFVQRERLPVRFHGRVPDAQDRLMDACFALVDGRMAIQEAMARRRLVLAAYDHPLKRDYVCGESFSPYLVAVDSANALVNRLRFFSENAEARRAIVDGAFAYARTLSWMATAEAYLKLWRSRITIKERKKPRLAWIGARTDDLVGSEPGSTGRHDQNDHQSDRS